MLQVWGPNWRYCNGVQGEERKLPTWSTDQCGQWESQVDMISRYWPWESARRRVWDGPPKRSNLGTLQGSTEYPGKGGRLRGQALQMVYFGACRWHLRDCNKGQAEWKGREPTWDAAHCDHWVPWQSKRNVSNDAEGGEFFYNLERFSVLNQMFSATEFQSIGNDGPGSDYYSSSPENINMSRRNTCLHIWVAVREQSSGNHTHDFLVEKIFKSEKQSLIFKVRLFIKHERMNQAKWRTPVSAASQEGQQVWLCLKIFLFIFSSTYVMYAFGLGAAMALEHMRSKVNIYAHMRPEVYICCFLLYFLKKPGPVSHRIWGLPFQLDCMPNKLLRLVSPNAVITQAAVLAVYHHATQLFMWMPRIWTEGLMLL